MKFAKLLCACALVAALSGCKTLEQTLEKTVSTLDEARMKVLNIKPMPKPMFEAPSPDMEVEKQLIFEKVRILNVARIELEEQIIYYKKPSLLKEYDQTVKELNKAIEFRDRYLAMEAAKAAK